jgi:hypothetical protein
LGVWGNVVFYGWICLWFWELQIIGDRFRTLLEGSFF